jgi:hypothetical protein
MGKRARIMMYLIVGIVGCGIVIFIIASTSDLVRARNLELSDEKEVHSERITQGKFWMIIQSEEARTLVMKDYGIQLPENDFNKNYLLISDGRKIKKIKYRLISKYLWQYEFPKGVATFGKEYYPHSIFVYKTNRIYIHRPVD